MHVIVRKRDDAAWPAPVWGKHPAKPYSAEQVGGDSKSAASGADQ
jgi:diadenosine tetraphosphate (Ap4A) HIT family hydrolase